MPAKGPDVNYVLHGGPHHNCVVKAPSSIREYQCATGTGYYRYTRTQEVDEFGLVIFKFVEKKRVTPP